VSTVERSKPVATAVAQHPLTGTRPCEFRSHKAREYQRPVDGERNRAKFARQAGNWDHGNPRRLCLDRAPDRVARPPPPAGTL
jgi:hypothetical protein